MLNMIPIIVVLNQETEVQNDLIFIENKVQVKLNIEFPVFVLCFVTFRKKKGLLIIRFGRFGIRALHN